MTITNAPTTADPFTHPPGRVPETRSTPQHSPGRERPGPPGKWGGQDDGYVSDVTEIIDMLELNRHIQQARARCWRLTHETNQASVEASAAEAAYQRRFRTELISRTERSAEARKAAAEDACAELDDQRRVASTRHTYVRTLASQARCDLEALYNLSHNLRAEFAYTAK